ncbi:hypothetical protein CEXT_331271 [Caerostris extrusa]|uniref:Uncharacterized protein n=1 Tax=Caerostris extrusa TaxID=172846 RepID=A0AAV4U5B1_CAEEX|nr:hypothetical protein CEXT_331271 [Caerostris extrusa]
MEEDRRMQGYMKKYHKREVKTASDAQLFLEHSLCFDEYCPKDWINFKMEEDKEKKSSTKEKKMEEDRREENEKENL